MKFLPKLSHKNRNHSKKSALTLLSLLKVGFSPTLHDFNKFIVYLYKIRRYKSIIHLFSQMDSNNVKVNSQTHTVFTKALIKEQEYEEALYFIKHNSRSISFPVRIFDAYKLVIGAESSPSMGVVEYTSMIDRLCKGGHIHEALHLCSLVSGMGITLGIVAYNSVIHGLCRQGCLVEALRLFDSLEINHMVPSEITYATIIDTLSKNGFLLDAMRMFERMFSKNLKPNARIYNSLINGFCKMGLTCEALKLLCDMEANCIKPDEFTVSTVINGYCQNGDMEGALDFFFELKNKDLSLDFLGFMCLLRGLSAKGRMEECRDVLRNMLQLQSVICMLTKVDTEVASESLKNFLIFLCEQGSIQEAINILDEVGSMFYPVGMRHNAGGTDYNSVSCNIKKLEKMLIDGSYLESEKARLSFGSFYTLISSLCSKGERLKATELAKSFLISSTDNS